MSVLFPATHSITILTKGSYIDGIWVEGAEDIQNITADIQTISGKEVESLDIGRKGVEKIWMASTTLYHVAEEESKQNGDIVIWEGKNYELIAIENWNHGLINHYEYIGELRI